MPRGVKFTLAQRRVLSQIMTDAWARKREHSVPARRMRFNPIDKVESAVIALISKSGAIDAYQFSPIAWKKIAPVLQKLKRKGIVKSKKTLVQGGVSGAIHATVWSLK